jgi:hypothetical protein
MFERLAKDPDVNVEKLERLIAMQERIIRHNAEAAFNAAFSEMQAELPTIGERSRTDKTSYAPLEDIIERIRPILRKYGFSISHRTEWPDKTTVKVVGILTHRQGHARESEFLSAADQTGSKNAIQALGSAVAYGRRYTTKDLLNIVTRHEDDDGDKATPGRDEPEGFDEWFADLTAVADNGTAALTAMWEAKDAKSIARKKYLVATNRKGWETLKARAAKVKAS